jgi:predicted DNA-binding antitoxin AbrB/MazE fold protein
MKTIDAIYENGVFRPLKPISLPEHQRVGLSIHEDGDDPLAELLDHTAADSLDFPLPGPGGLEAVRQALAKIEGTMTADFIAERDDRS